jgi:hypothetical protein
MKKQLQEPVPNSVCWVHLRSIQPRGEDTGTQLASRTLSTVWNGRADPCITTEDLCSSGRRDFASFFSVETLAFIRRAQDLRFKLSEIRGLLICGETAYSRVRRRRYQASGAAADHGRCIWTTTL